MMRFSDHTQCGCASPHLRRAFVCCVVPKCFPKIAGRACRSCSKGDLQMIIDKPLKLPTKCELNRQPIEAYRVPNGPSKGPGIAVVHTLDSPTVGPLVRDPPAAEQRE